MTEAMLGIVTEPPPLPTSWPILLLSGWLSYLVIRSVYRVFLSPIAHIPGPKLAAVTRWYEAYYEIVRGGQYSFHIDKLHDIYGPIIRVAPDEVHVRDATFYDELYTKNPRVEKPGWDIKFGSPGFSRRSILSLEHLIQQQTELLCKRIAEFRATKEPLCVTEMLPAFTGDIIMEYAFGFSYKQLESPTFESFHEAFMAIGGSAHVASFFPWAIAMLDLLPDKWVEKIQPRMASLVRLKRDQWSIIGRAIRKNAEHRKETENIEEETTESATKTTVFSEILSSTSLPTGDKSQQRLADEAQILVAAGVETTAFALSVGIFHIVNTPHIRRLLQDELFAAFPLGYRTMPSLHELEKLPYLRACIQESLRLSYGVSARNPRRHPDRTLRYEDNGKVYLIPKNTKVSMTIVDVHHDENIFPDSFRFMPERWLQEPKAPDGRPLEQYLVTFGKGTRICLGLNLAWAELFFAMGMMFRRFDFELHETDESDVRYRYDFFTPRVKLDSKGVRVIVY
ncbi:Trichodiene oxygenase [Talaromyces islandicus]|uniref:Trichodiene oxygenase n=1 Tax=Talaromyces islandicus TaxID=28573 RepID=A0A0U1LWY1_TALIS|nr:Trichodiene oxygenase [Talaromyces islandicus]